MRRPFYGARARTASAKNPSAGPHFTGRNRQPTGQGLRPPGTGPARCASLPSVRLAPPAALRTTRRVPGARSHTARQAQPLPPRLTAAAREIAPCSVSSLVVANSPRRQVWVSGHGSEASGRWQAVRPPGRVRPCAGDPTRGSQRGGRRRANRGEARAASRTRARRAHCLPPPRHPGPVGSPAATVVAGAVTRRL